MGAVWPYFWNASGKFWKGWNTKCKTEGTFQHNSSAFQWAYFWPKIQVERRTSVKCISFYLLSSGQIHHKRRLGVYKIIFMPVNLIPRNPFLLVRASIFLTILLFFQPPSVPPTAHLPSAVILFLYREIVFRFNGFIMFGSWIFRSGVPHFWEKLLCLRYVIFLWFLPLCVRVVYSRSFR